MAEDGKIKIDKFDGHGFGFWKMQIEDYLMKEGASVADHVNEFNSILSRLMSVDIKFDDEVQALLLLSFVARELKTKVGAESKTEGRSRTEVDLNQRREVSPRKGRISRVEIATRRATFKTINKEVNMAVRDYDDALLEKFRLCSGKVRLANNKILDIAGVGEVVLKTSFGTSWNLKDVRYIPGLKKRLIPVGQLDEERYPPMGLTQLLMVGGNAALWHQRLGYMSEKSMKILASKGRISDLQKAVVGFCEPYVLGK
ncbi:retrovirus-related pol polyprotein from transposon TNT 1-94 [Tanacetum coccineum]